MACIKPPVVSVVGRLAIIGASGPTHPSGPTSARPGASARPVGTPSVYPVPDEVRGMAAVHRASDAAKRALAIADALSLDELGTAKKDAQRSLTVAKRDGSVSTAEAAELESAFKDLQRAESKRSEVRSEEARQAAASRRDISDVVQLPAASSDSSLHSLRDEILARDLSGSSKLDAGKQGEALAEVALALEGWVPILDSAHTGVDLLMYHPDRGELLIVEVKSTTVGSTRFATTQQKTAGERDGTYQAGAKWVSDRLDRHGYKDLETAREMLPTLGVHVDLLTGDVTYHRSDDDGHHWSEIDAI